MKNIDRIWAGVLILFALALGVPAKAAHLSQNDVSILMPLPTSLSDDHLLRPTMQAAYGALIPQTIYASLPQIDARSKDEIYKNLRVVAIRLDPCFTPQGPGGACKAQVRLIWQPFISNVDNPVLMQDSAIHTFYDVPANEFAQLVTQLETLKAKFGRTVENEILTVNPLIKASGLTTGYGQELVTLLLSKIGGNRISQVTFMVLGVHQNMWTFGGLLAANGQKTANLTIARIPNGSQFFSNVVSSPGRGFSGAMGPSPVGTDTINMLTSDSSAVHSTDQARVTEETMATVRIENPLHHDSHTVDCVSCHTAQQAQLWAINEFPALGLPAQGAQFKFQSRFNLSNSTVDPGDTKMLRAFGYNLRSPAINQRVINETAAVLETLYPQ